MTTGSSLDSLIRALIIGECGRKVAVAVSTAEWVGHPRVVGERVGINSARDSTGRDYEVDKTVTEHLPELLAGRIGAPAPSETPRATRPNNAMQKQSIARRQSGRPPPWERKPSTLPGICQVVAVAISFKDSMESWLQSHTVAAPTCDIICRRQSLTPLHGAPLAGERSVKNRRGT